MMSILGRMGFLFFFNKRKSNTLFASNHVIAAVSGFKDETYKKFILDTTIPGIDWNTPYFNAGVLVINLKQWAAQNISEKIYSWLELNLEKPIYKFGSQPPLLLVFYKNYEEINKSWNVRHLGSAYPLCLSRMVLSVPLAIGHKEGINQETILKANLLHYNGPRKPWRRNRIQEYYSYWARYSSYGILFQ
jgi:alpha-1,4-galacturonosyltransferase